MRELIIGKNDAGARLDRFVSKALPLLPPALLQKYIRIKRIKVNGGRAQRDQRLTEGDVVQLYINDEFFDKPSEENMFLTLFKPQVDIVYEDENLLLVNKRPGLVVHADETEKVNTLINHIQAYLYQKREWNPRWENAFAPALCNRIDRNTGGMVIAAKNAETLRIINEKIRLREIDKRYLCITVGRPKPPEGRIECFLLKDEQKSRCLSTTSRYLAARPPSRTTARWRRGASCHWWRWDWRRGAPTRSGRPLPIWAARCWGTASTAGAM